jgi:phosphatidylserine synthase
MTTSPSNVRRGQLFVILAAAITLLGDAAVILMTASQTGGGLPIAGIARWLLTVALFVLIWKGHRWALWLIVCLLIAATALVVPVALRTMHPVFIAVIAQFVVTLILLLAPNSVSAFQESQRAKEPMTF